MIASYIFNDAEIYSPHTIHDFSDGGRWDLNYVSNIVYDTDPTDGWAAVFSGDSPETASYAANNHFILPSEQQPLSICIRMRSMSPPGGSTSPSRQYLVNSSQFYVSLDDEGYINFGVYGYKAISGTSSWYVTTSSVCVCDDAWHNIVCVADGTEVQIYTDGFPEEISPPAPAVFDYFGTSTTLGLILGAEDAVDVLTYFTGWMSYCIISEYALQRADVLRLAGSPQKGVRLVTTGNNFIIGDILYDITLNTGCVVIWSPDGINLDVLPWTSPFVEYPMNKVGNLWNAERQMLMKIANDYDGNGNGQIAVVGPIDSSSSLLSPAITSSIDDEGIINFNIPQYRTIISYGG